MAFLLRASPRTVDPAPPLDDRAVHAAAQNHARARFGQGLGAADVLTEFRLLRQEIGRALREELRGVVAADIVGAELLVHDALDGAMTLALAALDAQEAERRFLAMEVARLAVEKDHALASSRFLASAGSLLGSSLELDQTLASVARLVVGHIADWCLVYLVDRDGSVRRVAAAHADVAKDAQIQDLVLRFPLSPDPAHPVRRAIDQRETYAGPPTPVAELDRYATGPEHGQLLRELAMTSATVVPLVARGEVVGAISFGRTGDAPIDQPLAEELASRAALAIDNARLYEQAQDAVRIRDAFLETASHDLKGPLTVIGGQVQLIERRVVGRLPTGENDRLVQGLATIRTVAHRMAAIVNELVDVARLRAGQPLVLERKETDLVSLARRIATEAQETTSRHTIVVEATEPALIGDWDGFRLERVLGNLLSNAIKYSPEGGEVTVRVWRTEREDAPVAMVAVQDQGIGIPPADLPRIFSRFHRGANVVGRIRGEGIGLAGAKQIVEQHGGAIEVSSREGGGSTFTVRLPLRNHARQEAHRPPS